MIGDFLADGVSSSHSSQRKKFTQTVTTAMLPTFRKLLQDLGMYPNPIRRISPMYWLIESRATLRTTSWLGGP
jgi:hypothetical protein